MTFNTAAFKNPFADFDFTKVAGEFKIPDRKSTRLNSSH